MPKARRSPSKVSMHQRLAASLYLQGLYQDEIAKWLGISQATVSKDLKAVQERWKKYSINDMDAIKAEQLAKIDELERVNWESFVRSTCDIVHTTIWDHDEEEWMIETVMIPEVKPGDPRFLAGVDKCVERRCKMFGLDAPTQVELANKAGSELSIRVIGGIDLDKDI